MHLESPRRTSSTSAKPSHSDSQYVNIPPGYSKHVAICASRRDSSGLNIQRRAWYDVLELISLVSSLPMVDYVQYRTVLARIKSLPGVPRGRTTSTRGYYPGTLDAFMSLGLGSSNNGATFSHLQCANRDVFIRGTACSKFGVLLCSKVSRRQDSKCPKTERFRTIWQCCLVKVNKYRMFCWARSDISPPIVLFRAVSEATLAETPYRL
jgi:hypothetical protein